MNFKILALLIFVSGCGVKGDLINPRSNKVPSLMENYPDIELENSINDTKLTP